MRQHPTDAGIPGHKSSNPPNLFSRGGVLIQLLRFCGMLTVLCDVAAEITRAYGAFFSFLPWAIRSRAEPPLAY
jgi:hypothetical protein